RRVASSEGVLTSQQIELCPSHLVEGSYLGRLQQLGCGCQGARLQIGAGGGNDTPGPPSWIEGENGRPFEKGCSGRKRAAGLGPASGALEIAGHAFVGAPGAESPLPGATGGI